MSYRSSFALRVSGHCTGSFYPCRKAGIGEYGPGAFPRGAAPEREGKQREKGYLLCSCVDAEVGRSSSRRSCCPPNTTRPKSRWTIHEQNAIHWGVLLAIVLSGGGVTVVLARRRRVGAAIAACVVMVGLAVTIGTVMAATPPDSHGPGARRNGRYRPAVTFRRWNASDPEEATAPPSR